MIDTDVLIVGGGPAGSACARRLRQHGMDCLILDQKRFPRFKPCAGWITPQVLNAAGLNVSEYPHSFTTFDALYVTIFGLHLKLATRQYAIRRFEFDAWLLERSGAPVYEHTVRSLTRTHEGNAGPVYVADGAFRGRFLVGAGGTTCPVFRSFFKPPAAQAKPAHAREDLIVALEDEFQYPYTDPRCQLWFLEDHLPGYAWYVPKAGGWVNVGVGGKAEDLNARGDSIKAHWARLTEKLARLGLVSRRDYQPSAHSYALRARSSGLRACSGEIQKENIFLAGDSAGLATRDMGEGISAAIQSGILAADAIALGKKYSLASIPRYSLFPGVILEALSAPLRPKPG